MSRGEQSMHISNGSWHCENCSTSANNKGVDSGDRRQAAPSRKTDVSRRGCLKLLQWNAKGIRTNMVELEDRIRKFNLDIIMIQETKLRALDKNPAIKGYSTVRKDRGVGSGGGLLFFIKEDILFTTIDNTPSAQNSLLEIQSIELRAKPFVKTLLSNVYCPPSRGANHGNEFEMSELPHDRNAITGGDLNAHSQMWDRWQPEDSLGSNLEEWLMEKDVCIAKNGAATRNNPGTGGSSAPDVTLVHSSWLDRVEWSTTECLGSDHLPILITVDCQVTTLNAPSRTELKWNWKSSNFRLFVESVDEAVTAAPAAIH